MDTDDAVFKDQVTSFTLGTRCIHLCYGMHSKVLAKDTTSHLLRIHIVIHVQQKIRVICIHVEQIYMTMMQIFTGKSSLFGKICIIVIST